MTPDRTENKKCACPHCESELTDGCMEPDFCMPCTVEFETCPSCGQRFAASLKTCPQCNTARRGAPVQ